MNQDELNAIQQRRKAATPGTWIAVPIDLTEESGDPEIKGYFITTQELLDLEPEPLYIGSVAKHRLMSLAGQDPEDTANATFIAHAPQDIDRLLAEVRRLGRLTVFDRDGNLLTQASINRLLSNYEEDLNTIKRLNEEIETLRKTRGY